MPNSTVHQQIFCT